LPPAPDGKDETMKLPRQEVLDQQAKAMREAEAELKEEELEEATGGRLPLIILMYGIGIIRELLK
jgi:hypothetical protein